MFDCLGIAVKDMQSSIDFYNLLGLEFTKFGEEHFEAKTESGIRLMLDTHRLLKEINPNWTKAQNPSTTLGFRENDSTQVDELFNKIKSNGYRVIQEPWDAFWGQRYSSVLDPDGNQIDIFSPLEKLK
jgi:uncharacterized glyoxalase superfamily protein PhnB